MFPAAGDLAGAEEVPLGAVGAEGTAAGVGVGRGTDSRGVGTGVLRRARACVSFPGGFRRGKSKAGVSKAGSEPDPVSARAAIASGAKYPTAKDARPRIAIARNHQ